MTTPLRIESMYAFIQLDPADNTEGVIAFLNQVDRTWMPMVGADMERIEQIRPKAELTAKVTGRPVLLVHFTIREEIEVIQP